MNKCLLIFIVPLLLCCNLSAQITQEQADDIVIERMSNVMEVYTIYANEDVQTGFEITTTTGEIIELDYPAWVYYVDLLEETNGKYVIVKENNGNLLEVNTKNDEGQEGLTEWRVLYEIPFSLWKHTVGDHIIELIFYSSVHRLHVKPTPNPLPSPPFYVFVADYFVDYYIEDEILNFLAPGTTHLLFRWIITHISENTMRLNWKGALIPWYVGEYLFICQTNFCEI